MKRDRKDGPDDERKMLYQDIDDFRVGRRLVLAETSNSFLVEGKRARRLVASFSISSETMNAIDHLAEIYGMSRGRVVDVLVEKYVRSSGGNGS